VKLFELLFSYLPVLPIYLTWLVGAILALARWQRHPKVSLVMLISAVVFILGLLIQVAGYYWATNVVLTGGGSIEEVRWLLLALALVNSLFTTTGAVLLLVAVFGWRDASRAEPSEEDLPGTGMKPSG